LKESPRHFLQLQLFLWGRHVRIICEVIGKSENNEPCVFSVPANPIDAPGNNVYHTGVIELILTRLGFEPHKIDEGHSVVFAEMEESEYTGVGISCGGGMSNICVSYRSLPTLSFSIARGGDWIDDNVARSMDLAVSRVTAVKEEGFDLLAPKGRIQEALAIYYRDLIKYTVDQIGRQMNLKKNMPVFVDPVEVVVCGGSSLVKNFEAVFNKELETAGWPIEVAQMRLAKDPLKTVAKGCLNAALEHLE